MPAPKRNEIWSEPIHMLSFYKPPTLREQLATRANAPLKPSKAQKVLPKSGLFGP